MRGRAAILLSIAAALAVATAAATTGAVARDRATQKQARPCEPPRLSPSYVRRVNRALHARRDVWGKMLLRSRNGPTYEAAARFLNPPFLARAANGKPLTESGVHYAPFAMPNGAWGATSVALHVADGSQIVAERAHGRRLTIAVGRRGLERYGSCLRRLAAPSLGDGFLPVLETRYADAEGVRYRQESFAAHVAETTSLVSFVRLTADATSSRSRLTRIRFTPSTAGLASADGRLTGRGRTYLFFSEGGSFNGASVKYAVPAGTVRTVYVAWLNSPRSSRPLAIDDVTYEAARDSVREYWERRLLHGGTIVVPEKRVLDAERNLLIQNLSLTWRYSIGNAYEQLSSPEGMDVARVLAGYGQPEVSRAILHTALRTRPARRGGEAVRSLNWKLAARLVATAEQARLSGDRSFVLRKTPVLRRYVRALGAQIKSSRSGLLRRERFSSDVAQRVYGLHSQTVAWQGLRSMADVWEELGKRSLARDCRRLAARLGSGLRRAVRASDRRLGDGSVFLPVRLFDHEPAYPALTASRAGSYWNLVMPYALASGFFEPRAPRALGILEYMRRHGSRLLGLPRAGAYPLYGRTLPAKRPAHVVSGSNPVYGLNVARFLADNDQAPELVLSLYGHLAAAMAPGTFVSGEGISVAPLGGAHYRSMYLPPNGASNATFLEILRLMLVHETVSRRGVPRGLELAFATPRSWLGPGKRIEVRRLPTSFGRISFAMEAQESSVAVSLTIPARRPVQSLRLRLRLPAGARIASATFDGVTLDVSDPRSGTFELPTTPGSHDLLAQVVR